MADEPEDGAHARGGLLGDFLLETYLYPPGPAGTTPSHVHDEYQFCLGDGPSSRYRYRGGWHLVPPGQLSVVMPGEVHLAVETEDRLTTSGYQVLYASESRMRELSAELNGGAHFSSMVLEDRQLATGFRQLHTTFADPPTPLFLEIGLLSLLAALVTRHTKHPAEPGPVKCPTRAIPTVRAYLEEHFAASVTLEELARLAELSPFHLARLFRQEVGMPPHAYQLQVRLIHAKRLLLRGVPVSKVANETGFFDLSHFTRHFKRQLGVAPGRYVLERKNVHYGGR